MIALTAPAVDRTTVVSNTVSARTISTLFAVVAVVAFAILSVIPTQFSIEWAAPVAFVAAVALLVRAGFVVASAISATKKM